MKPMVRKGKRGSREKRVFEPDMYKYGELFGKKEDENFLINNATFGSGNMNLKDTYGDPEISKAYTLAKQIRVGTVPKSPKRQMLYFVRDMVHFYRSNGFHRLADTMAKDIQFFDVNEIFEYVSINIIYFVCFF